MKKVGYNQSTIVRTLTQNTVTRASFPGFFFSIYTLSLPKFKKLTCGLFKMCHIENIGSLGTFPPIQKEKIANAATVNPFSVK